MALVLWEYALREGLIWALIWDLAATKMVLLSWKAAYLGPDLVLGLICVLGVRTFTGSQ